MTPTNHDDLSNDLGRALHDRADGIGAPLTLADVKGKATRIRRRRAIAASTAVAAAVAIIVPTALAGSDLFEDSSDGGKQIATNDPTPNPTETGGDSQSWPQRLDTSDLELGELPAVPWRENGVLQGPDAGPSFGFPTTPYDDGWLGIESTNSGYQAVILDAEGNVVSESPSADQFAVSDDGNQVLWLDGDALTLHDNETGEDTVIGTGLAGSEPIGVANGTAYYNVGDWPMDGRYWDGAEHDPLPGDPIPYTNVAADGTTTVLSSLDDFGSCSTLLSPEHESLGETCDLTLDEFAPGGGHLLAGPAYRDGFGDGELAVLPADGAAIEENQVVFHYQRKGDADPYFMESVWEDDSHILTVTFTPNPGSATGTWQILRIGLDGSVENAVEPVEAGDLDGPFALS